MNGYLFLFQEIIVSAIDDYVRGVLVSEGIYPSQGKQRLIDIKRDAKSAIYFLWGGGLDDWVETTGMEKYLNIYAVREQAVDKAGKVTEWLKAQGKIAQWWGKKSLLEQYMREI